jgi:hypothetical protein
VSYTVLFALWAIAEALHVRRALRNGASAGPDMRVAFRLGFGVLAALLLAGLGPVILITSHAITRVFRVRVRAGADGVIHFNA